MNLYVWDRIGNQLVDSHAKCNAELLEGRHIDSIMLSFRLIWSEGPWICVKIEIQE